jgi:hypothetical protein
MRTVEDRIAPLTEAAPSGAEPAPTELALRVMPPQVTSAAIMNRPDVRRASISGGGSIMSARPRHDAMLAGDGILDGTRLLSSERCQTIRTLQTDAVDVLFGGRSPRGLGYSLGGDP